jgi:hypothetical protein
MFLFLAITGSTSSCEPESAACFPSGHPHKNVGYVKDPLYLDDSGRPTIKYVLDVKGDQIPEDCTQSPSTTVTFMCPTRGQVRYFYYYYANDEH